MFKKLTSGLLALLLILSMFPVQAFATEPTEIPVVTEAVEQTVPAEETIPAEETVPVTEETVPVTEETVPVTEETVPATEETVPATEETVPVTEETVPATEETVPVTEETVPATEETVPVTEETVPATEETVPVIEEDVPVTEEIPGIKTYEAKTLVNSYYQNILPELYEGETFTVQTYNAAEEAVAEITLDEPALYSSAQSVLREKLVARQQNFTMNVRTTRYPNNDFAAALFFEAMEEHTKNPKEGDYLTYQWLGGSAGVVEYYVDGSYYVATVRYSNIRFMTTAAQEKTMDEQVKALLNKLDLDGYKQYEKIRIIYDWMTKNIRYDYANLNNNNYTLKHSAYAALINRTAVCQGYSNLLYRLLLEADVDVREVPSIDEECHIWNIVRLDGKYYNCDATWDEGETTYRYFLRCPSSFDSDHTRRSDYRTSSFHSKYPMASSNYDIRNVVIRLAGTNRCETSTKTANRLKTVLGVEKFKNIVVADARNFPDALAGSYLASVAKAPLLLFQESSRNLIMNYINQNLKEGGTVYILGQKDSVPNTVEKNLKSGVKSVRLAGNDRYATCLQILKKADSLKGSTPTKVLVCTGKNFADALSASATGLPILLVNGTSSNLTSAQKSYLSSLNRKAQIYVIGGGTAVTGYIRMALEAYDKDGTVERISGDSREKTAVAVAKSFFPNAHTAAIAYSKNFPDGLSGGPVAYAMGAPLLLVTNTNTSAAYDYVVQKGVIKGFIIGGHSQISNSGAKKVFGSNINIKE